jgi:hypothetical protein
MFQPFLGHLQGVNTNYVSGYQSVVRGSQGICDQFAGDPWILLCNGYFEGFFFN